MTSKEILCEFDQRIPNLERFNLCLRDLLCRLLEGHQITPHSVTSRVKKRGSFEEKLKRKGKNYASLSDVTDLVGVRIISYLTSDVDVIADIIESEFTIDLENSVDKRRYDDPDRFGYKSLHYVVELKSARTDLTEYKPFVGIKAEIQVRTIIQHAWAEIEHDLGYKSSEEIPNEIRRRFFRLSALLETADVEFSAISEDIDSYRLKVRAELAAGERSREIDATTIDEFLKSDSIVLSIADELAVRSNLLVEAESVDYLLAHTIKFLHWCNITKLADIEAGLLERRQEIVNIASERLAEHPDGSFARTVVLLYLAYSILADRDDPGELVKFLAENHFGNPESGNEIFDSISAYRNQNK